MAEIKITITAEDKSSGAFSAVTQSTKNAVQNLGALGNVLQRVKGVAADFFAAMVGFNIVSEGAKKIKELVSSFVEVNSLNEQYTATLKTLLKSQEAANRTFEDLNAFARETPYQIEDVMNSFIMMKSYGLNPTIESMKILGDTASALGGGADKLGGIARALGQISAKGRVSAEELMQLAEQGVPAYEILSQKLRLTGAQVADIGNQSITSDKAIKALFEGMNERFGGQMQNMQSTWKGVIEEIKSLWRDFLSMIGASGAFEELKQQAKDIRDRLKDAFDSGKVKQWAVTTSNLISSTVKTTAEAFSTISGVAKEVAGAWDALLFGLGVAAMAAAPKIAAALSAAVAPLFAGGIIAGGPMTMLAAIFGGVGYYVGDLANKAVKSLGGKSVSEYWQEKLFPVKGIDYGDTIGSAIKKLGVETQNAAMKTNTMAVAQRDLNAAIKDATAAVESQKNTLKSLYHMLASDFSKTVDDLTKKQQDLFNFKLTTGDLVSQVKQTLMDPVEKYTEKTTQLLAKEKVALELSSDEKIRLLQSVQQQWASMIGEIKNGDKVWKTADETAATAIGNIKRIGSVLEKEKSEQIEDTKNLLEQLRSEYDKLKTIESNVLTLKIDTSEFMSKIAASQTAVQALHDKVSGVNSMNVAITASGSETLPITEKVEQVMSLLEGLAGETTYNLDLSAFTSAINLLYSISRERALWEYAGKADYSWMNTPIGLLEKALSAVVGKAGTEEGSYQSGTSYVPKTGLYRLHQGEQVLTAHEAANSDNRSYRTVNNISLGGIQITAKDSDDPRKLVQKIVKPLKAELKRLETYTG